MFKRSLEYAAKDSAQSPCQQVIKTGDEVGWPNYLFSVLAGRCRTTGDMGLNHRKGPRKVVRVWAFIASNYWVKQADHALVIPPWRRVVEFC